MKKSVENLHKQWDIIKTNNLWIIGVPEEEKGRE